MRRLRRMPFSTITGFSSAILAVAGLLAAGSTAAVAGDRRATTFVNWPAYLDGTFHHSYNVAATAITPANVTSLKQVWRWVPAKPTMTGQPGWTQKLFASPTVYDGRIYIGANSGVFYALSESTGKVIWHRFLGFVTQKTCAARGFTSTATVAIDPATKKLTIYVAAADGYLYALNAATGATVWRSVVAIPSSTKNDYYNWSSPTVAGGRIYLGVTSECDNPLVMGGLKEYDQATGDLLAFWESNPGGKKGPSIWSSAGSWQSGKFLFVTTGNGRGPNQESVIRLDQTTLAKLSQWQVPKSQQIYDSDFGGSPTLFTATLHGHSVPMVGACNKNGIYYALRQAKLAAGPVWSYAIGAPAGSSGECDAAASFDGSQLFLAGNQTTIAGTTFGGSVAMVDPSTGVPAWQTGLAGPVIGSPTMDGAGVIAAPTYSSNGLYLLNAATGKILKQIKTGPEFGQAVFSDNMLLVPSQNDGLYAYAPTSPSRQTR